MESRTGNNLTIKDNWQLWRIHSRPLDFLGFKFYKDKTVLRKRIFIAMNRRVNRVKKKGYCTVRTARGIKNRIDIRQKDKRRIQVA